jgi:hypothetical protein
MDASGLARDSPTLIKTGQENTECHQNALNWYYVSPWTSTSVPRRTESAVVVGLSRDGVSRTSGRW